MELISNEYSLVELRLIQGLWTNTSIQDIADILGRKHKDVRQQIETMDKTNHKLFKPKIISKPMPRLPKELPEHVKRSRKVFAKRHIDESKLIRIAIDSKTNIYVKPGTNIDAIKNKYSNYKNFDK